MKLQTHIALIPLIAVSILTFGLYVLINRLTINSFNSLELETLKKQVVRVNNSIDNLVEEHALKIVDWAQWDKTYDFMEKNDPSYVNETLNPLTLSALGFNSVLYFKPSMDFYYGVDLVEDTKVESSNFETIDAFKKILSNSPSESFQGIIELHDNIFIFAVSPILPNKGDQESRGKLIATSKITEDSFKLIQHLTNLKVKFFPRNQITKNDAINIVERLKNNSAFAFNIVSSELSYAYGSVKDFNNEPLVYFEVENSIGIISSGLKVRNFSISILAASGCLAIFLLLIVIHVSVTRRIARFSTQVRQIAQSGDSSINLQDNSLSKNSLRFKTASGVLLVFLSMSVITSLLFNNYFLDAFREVGDKVVSDNVERASRALQGRLDKLKAKTIDWAQWDDTYQFIEDHNQSYSSDNLGFDTLGTMNLSYVLYFNSNGEYVDGKHINIQGESTGPIDNDIISAFKSAKQLSQASEPIVSFLALPTGNALVASSPILDTSREKPSRGCLMFASLADDNILSELSKQTKLDVHFTKMGVSSSRLIDPITYISSNEVWGNKIIKDIANNPVMNITVKSDRPIFQQGLLAAKVLPLYFIVGGILCALATLLCVDKILLSRIHKMGEEVSEIKLLDSTEMISTSGSDEITSLANDINSMLVALQKTQQELKDARYIAESANAAKSQFLASVSHELRTPIHGILGMLRMLFKNEKSTSKLSQIQMAYNTTQGLLETINDLLDMSKAEAGKLAIELKEFSMRHVIRDVLQTIGPRAHEKHHLEIISKVETDLPSKLLGDPNRIRQILMNLLGNAVKFTPEGYIELKVEMKRSESNLSGLSSSNQIKTDRISDILIISCRDSGIGIAEEQIGKIFQAYEQADSSKAGKPQGTGLGLNVVKQLTENMGGKLSVTSKIGEGTEFIVEIPVEEIEACPVKEIKALKVATLSEEESFSKLVNISIEMFGVAALDFNRESLKDIIEKSPNQSNNSFDADAIIVDSKILHDAKVWSHLKIAKNDFHKKIIVLSTTNDLVHRDRLELLGVNSIILRPFLPDDLFDTLMDKKQGTEIQLAETGMTASTKVKGLSNLHVLIADDTKTNQIILANLLEEAGHSVSIVHDGQEMIEAVEKGTKFDIILTDVQMPRIDGLTATKIIRDKEQAKLVTNGIPIIAVTAHAFPEEQQKMIEIGVNGVITKPIDPVKLRKVFEEIFADQIDLSTEIKEENKDARSVPSEEQNIFSSSNEYINSEDLLMRAGGKLRIAKMILMSFIEANQQLLTDLSIAFENNELAIVSSKAHALKGILLDIGSKEVASLAAWIEGNAQQAEIGQIDTAIQALIEKIKNTSEAVNDLLSEWEVKSQSIAAANEANRNV